MGGQGRGSHCRLCTFFEPWTWVVKLWGVGSRKSHHPCPPISCRGVCTEIFSTFLFFVSEGWVRMGGGVGQQRVGGLVYPLCTSTNAVSVFSLSLSRARTPAPTRHPGPSHAGGPVGEDRPLCPCPPRRGHQHAARRSPLVARVPTSPQTLVAQPSGASVLGARGAIETVSCLWLPPQKRRRHATPHHQQIQAATLH